MGLPLVLDKTWVSKILPMYFLINRTNHVSIVISSESNANNNSYSNLGSSYITPLGIHGSNEARNFLAGSYNFTVSEIEVFLVHN